MASKRRIRRLTCKGKRKYKSRSMAIAVTKTHPGQHSYKCPYCHFWHNGHMPGAVRAAILRRREES